MASAKGRRCRFGLSVTHYHSTNREKEGGELFEASGTKTRSSSKGHTFGGGVGNKNKTPSLFLGRKPTPEGRYWSGVKCSSRDCHPSWGGPFNSQKLSEKNRIVSLENSSQVIFRGGWQFEVRSPGGGEKQCRKAVALNRKGLGAQTRR